MLFIKLVVCIVLTELLTELVIKSEIFRPLREKVFFTWGNWFEKLFSCGYCFSVWVAFAVVFSFQIYYPLIGSKFLNLTLSALIIHRASNILHNIIDKWTDKYYDVRYVSSTKL